MPPRSTSTPNHDTDTAFGRAHPNLQKTLIAACQASGPLLIGTILWSAGFMKRPMWERALLWRAYLWTYISRWVLVSCAITWTLAGWGNQNEGQEQAQEAED
ncbi:hypothetical protein EDD37DRAFT_30834 [Exophiala viscosa]|nr:hypothetical protein EDD37DRAFT_30834 [Exophiala viscosa]